MIAATLSDAHLFGGLLVGSIALACALLPLTFGRRG